MWNRQAMHFHRDRITAIMCIAATRNDVAYIYNESIMHKVRHQTGVRDEHTGFPTDACPLGFSALTGLLFFYRYYCFFMLI